MLVSHFREKGLLSENGLPLKNGLKMTVPPKAKDGNRLKI